MTTYYKRYFIFLAITLTGVTIACVVNDQTMPRACPVVLGMKSRATGHQQALTESPPARRAWGLGWLRGKVAPSPECATPAPFISEAIKLAHWRESRNGADPKCKRGIIGPDGEEGEYQTTPIWRRDCKRLFGVYPDPYNLAETRLHILKWLRYYAPRVGASTPDELYELYNCGPTGYRKWRKHYTRLVELAAKKQGQ